jgi:hypothetical protein
MDLTQSIEPNSSQINADDLLANPRTVTITGVEAGSAEQPVFVHVAEIPDRTWRPSKSMRRVLVTAWGPEAANYIGRRVTLIRNPEITFGPNKVGGIEVSHLSHIEKPLTVALTATRGRRKNFTVQPLTDAPAPRDWAAEIALAASDLSALEALGKAAKQAEAGDDVVGQIRAAYKAASPAAAKGADDPRS